MQTHATKDQGTAECNECNAYIQRLAAALVCYYYFESKIIHPKALRILLETQASLDCCLQLET
jgi:hypothetical protein